MEHIEIYLCRNGRNGRNGRNDRPNRIETFYLRNPGYKLVSL